MLFLVSLNCSLNALLICLSYSTNITFLVQGPLIGYPGLSGISLQSFPNMISSETRAWVRRSAQSGVKWVVSNDEQGPAQDGIVPDTVDPDHDIVRKQILWSNIMNSGGGVEYYFGYNHPNSDLTCEDYRSRGIVWNMTTYALSFFSKFSIPLWMMTESDNLLADTVTNECLAATDMSLIIVYLPNGGEEFMSYLQTGESMIIGKDNDWTRWYDNTSGRILQIQNNDGSWSGHHCITSPVFCTATCLLILSVNNDVDKLVKQGKN